MTAIGLWLLIGLIGSAVYFAVYHRRKMAALTLEQREEEKKKEAEEGRYW